MGRQIVVNGEVFSLAEETPTAGQLKQQLQTDPNAMVVYTRDNTMTHLNDNQPIPLEVQDVSVVPGHYYGGR